MRTQFKTALDKLIPSSTDAIRKAATRGLGSCEKREEQAREAAQAAKEERSKGFSVSINKADTTRDELQGLLAESKRLAEKQTGNIRRINDLLGFGSVHIDPDFQYPQPASRMMGMCTLIHKRRLYALSVSNISNAGNYISTSTEDDRVNNRMGTNGGEG